MTSYKTNLSKRFEISEIRLDNRNVHNIFSKYDTKENSETLESTFLPYAIQQNRIKFGWVVRNLMRQTEYYSLSTSMVSASFLPNNFFSSSNLEPSILLTEPGKFKLFVVWLN